MFVGMLSIPLLINLLRIVVPDNTKMSDEEMKSFGKKNIEMGQE